MPAANAYILIEHYKKFFSDTNDVKTIFEIGANNLEDTKIFNKYFQNAKIYAFEPRFKKHMVIG